MSHRDGVDTAATYASFAAAAAAAGPDAAPLADAVWARLDSDRWTLEWQLPAWLGLAFGLDPALVRRFGTSNVLGLASIRLEDDLADGEIAAADAAVARRLAAALYEAALEPYRSGFPARHPFWARLDAWMAEWRRATAVAAPAALGSVAHRDARAIDLGWLATRGTPLKIPAYALCVIAGRERDFPRLERCLDHALRAMVLYDHACDWRADVGAGRWNAFAAGEVDLARVEARLLVGGAVGPYFARIDRELRLAQVEAAMLGVGALADHLSGQRTSIAAQGRSLDARYGALATAATQLFFGQPAT